MTNESQYGGVRTVLILVGGVLLLLIVGFVLFLAIYAWADIH